MHESNVWMCTCVCVCVVYIGGRGSKDKPIQLWQHISYKCWMYPWGTSGKSLALQGRKIVFIRYRDNRYKLKWVWEVKYIYDSIYILLWKSGFCSASAHNLDPLPNPKLLLSPQTNFHSCRLLLFWYLLTSFICLVLCSLCACMACQFRICYWEELQRMENGRCLMFLKVLKNGLCPHSCCV